MSALHWEARRKQIMVDRKAEERDKNEWSEQADLQNESESLIQKVAEEMSRDPATPILSLLNRSHARLSKRNPVERICDTPEYVNCGVRQGQDEYSAKIRNRYTSIDYIQQY